MVKAFPSICEQSITIKCPNFVLINEANCMREICHSIMFGFKVALAGVTLNFDPIEN